MDVRLKVRVHDRHTESDMFFLSMTLEETPIKSFHFPRVYVYSLQIL